MKPWLAFPLMLLALLAVGVDRSVAGMDSPFVGSGDRAHTYSARVNETYSSFYEGFNWSYLAPEWFWVREKQVESLGEARFLTHRYAVWHA
jgi:hypothetical protein